MIRAILDKVVVKLHEAEEKSPGGILLPEKAQKKSMRATVVATGPGAWVDGRRIPTEVEPGDEVIVGHYAVNKFTHEGEEFVAVQAVDILAKCEKGGSK